MPHAEWLPHWKPYVWQLIATRGSRREMCDPAEILEEGRQRADSTIHYQSIFQGLPKTERIAIYDTDQAIGAVAAWGGSGANIPLELVRQVVKATLRTQQLERNAEAREVQA